MTPTPPPSATPAGVAAPRRPRRARVFRIAAVVALALLVVAYGVRVLVSGHLYFDVGVDNREPDWVKVTAVGDGSILVLADGRRFRALAGDAAARLDDLFEWDVSSGRVYADVERPRTPGADATVVLHHAWARCGNSFMSPNPFDSVPYYQRLMQFDVERVTTE